MTSSFKEKTVLFLKMIHFELKHMRLFLFGLMGIVALLNIGGTIYHISNHRRRIESYMARGLDVEGAVRNVERISLRNLVHISPFFVYPILLSVAGFLLYALYIWYREWLGKSTFIYRLLMLPISRLAIFYSKVISFFIGLFSLVAFQHWVFAICEWLILQFSIAETFIPNTLSERSHIGGMGFILGGDVITFFVSYGLGFMFILCLFTAILLERSYKWVGFLMGGALCILLPISWALIVMFPEFLNNTYRVFRSELILIFIAMQLLKIIGLTFLSRYLLNHKISVR